MWEQDTGVDGGWWEPHKCPLDSGQGQLPARPGLAGFGVCGKGWCGLSDRGQVMGLAPDGPSFSKLQTRVKVSTYEMNNTPVQFSCSGYFDTFFNAVDLM